MALSEDQRAMLQLLLERGQSYEDIGSLLGIEVSEVHSRARAALTEIGGADPDQEVGLTDYLLGQADPIGRADAARHLQADDDARVLAEKLVAQLRLLAPGAELPDPTAGRSRASAKAPSSPPDEDSGSAAPTGPGFAASLSQRQRLLLGGLLGGALLLVLIILLATGAFSGGSDSSSKDRSASKSGPSKDQGPPRATLKPQGGGKGKGVAALGQTKNVPVIQLNAVNLDRAPPGQHYTLWLYHSKRVALRLGATTVSKRGSILAQFPLPTQAIPYISNGSFDFIDLSLTSDSAYKAEVKTATSSRTLPPYTGTSVLRGKIVGAGVGQTPASSNGGGIPTSPTTPGASSAPRSSGGGGTSSTPGR